MELADNDYQGAISAFSMECSYTDSSPTRMKGCFEAQWMSLVFMTNLLDSLDIEETDHDWISSPEPFPAGMLCPLRRAYADASGSIFYDDLNE
jgi:hypothetical protein